jgi:hypothetical protein
MLAREEARDTDVENRSDSERKGSESLGDRLRALRELANLVQPTGHLEKVAYLDRYPPNPPLIVDAARHTLRLLEV